ncbi:hypothetical protein MNBD_CHLOROFLEXI01-1111 [hydrothermal vent metagenome]|uniref:Uncharacterized protein n=1 Tax=hydrothermal vent metagenome TaxID=652676 RepID=A0A3B0VBZ6_9ZZZZ
MPIIINTNDNKRYGAFIGLIVIVCWVVFALSGCATQTKQVPVDAEVAVIEPSPMAVATTASPAVATVKATATDTATAPLTVASLTPTMETATPTPTATTIVPGPTRAGPGTRRVKLPVSCSNYHKHGMSERSDRDAIKLRRPTHLLKCGLSIFPTLAIG